MILQKDLLKRPNKCRELVPGVMIAMKITHAFRTITVMWKMEESALGIFVRFMEKMEVLPNKMRQAVELMPSVFTDYVFHHLN